MDLTQLDWPGMDQTKLGLSRNGPDQIGVGQEWPHRAGLARNDLSKLVVTDGRGIGRVFRPQIWMFAILDSTNSFKKLRYGSQDLS